MGYYINFHYTNISYDDTAITGHFHVWECDGDVDCDFYYDRLTEEIEIYNNNKAAEEILPIPIWWLTSKLEKDGNLPEATSKISY